MTELVISHTNMKLENCPSITIPFSPIVTNSRPIGFRDQVNSLLTLLTRLFLLLWKRKKSTLN